MSYYYYYFLIEASPQSSPFSCLKFKLVVLQTCYAASILRQLLIITLGVPLFSFLHWILCFPSFASSFWLSKFSRAFFRHIGGKMVIVYISDSLENFCLGFLGKQKAILRHIYTSWIYLEVWISPCIMFTITWLQSA